VANGEQQGFSSVPEFDEFGFVKGYVCPNCKSKVKLHHVDDVGTQWFLCEKCGRYSTRLKPKEREHLERTLNEMKDVIQVGDLTIQPIFNGLSKKVHPAIGVVDGIAYVGVALPCMILDKENRPSEKELHFLITSDCKKVFAHRDVLSKLKWKLEYRCVYFENRWSLESIQAFLNGEVAVNPRDVYEMVKTAWKTYLEFDQEVIYDFLTLWTIGTYFFHLFNAYPYVYIGGLKRSGKTKVLTVASLMTFNAIFSNNLSTSSIFRLIQSGRCTLLMDETEKLSNKERASELRNLLLSGYKKGAKVYRTEKTSKDRLVPEAFEVYSPKMIANIRGLEDVLEDRCITIIMKRGKNKEILNSEPLVNDPTWQKIRDALYTLYLTYFGELSELTELCVYRGNDIAERELELWKPIFVLAKFFDSSFPLTSQSSSSSLYSLMVEFAKRKCREKKIENMTETGEYILVQTLMQMVDENRYYKVKEIKEAVAKNFDEEQKWLNTAWVGRALRRLGFTDKRRVGTGYEYLLKKEHIKDLAERLGITEPEEQSFGEKLEAIRKWVIENKDAEGLIDSLRLADKIKEYNLPPAETIQKLKDEGFLFEVPKLSKWGVAT